MTRIALIGAGYVSRVHAEAVRLIPGLDLTAVIDPLPGNAQALGRDYNIPLIFASVEEALAADAFDRAHVLVPPDRHAAVAETLIAAGKPALVEKPLADSAAASRRLTETAKGAGIALGVNQNFVHHPAFARLRAFIDRRGLGKPNHITCVYNVPLRQLSLRQFGHWMFAEPGNLLLEQAVHPLSQIAVMAGGIGDIRVRSGAPLALGGGKSIYPSFDAIIGGRALPASLRFAVGQAYPFWQLSVMCDDGVAASDMLTNRFYTIGRTRWLEVMDNLASASRTAGAMIGASLRNSSDYALAMLRLKERKDPFLQSMVGSIKAFHGAVDAERPPSLDAAFGAMLVETCERIRNEGFARAQGPAAESAMARPAQAEAASENTGYRTIVSGVRAVVEAVATLQSGAPGEVLLLDERDGAPKAAPPVPAAATRIAILGGTGFIGTHLVRRCIADGIGVTVMARSRHGLPDLFGDPLVTLHAGSIADPAAVDAAIAGAGVVVNLAHGGGGSTREQVEASMVGGARMVAEACLRQNNHKGGVGRLIHIGSIASLYLGPQRQPVTGLTPPDPGFEERADYARAKAICDRMLLEMYERSGLPVVILRPGLVVGDGGIALHSGLGFFNNEQHCLGWNDGGNKLPFVLAEDVAEAILCAGRAGGVEGRCYNLVGDVRPSARDYIQDLGLALQRPLKFHPQSPLGLLGVEFGKWAIKRAGGRTPAPPSRRDILSRGLCATFDCSDAKRDLGWRPVADPALFHDRAIHVHAA